MKKDLKVENSSIGKVLDLFVSIQGETNRFNKTRLLVDKGGVREDKFYEKNPNRPILITSISSYELATKNNIAIEFSDLGENILIDLDIYHLLPSDQIKIGSTILEITQNCTICNGLSKVDDKLPKLLENSRGVFAKVISGDVIKTDDIVNIL